VEVEGGGWKSKFVYHVLKFIGGDYFYRLYFFVNTGNGIKSMKLLLLVHDFVISQPIECEVFFV